MPKPEVPSEMIVHASRRLRAVQLMLGLRNAEMANLLGVQENTYGNWMASNPTRRIPETAALRLWQRERIPMEFIYGGDLSRTEYDLAVRLRAACAEVGAAVDGPFPEFPMAGDTASGPRTVAAIPKRQRGQRLHEDPAPPPHRLPRALGPSAARPQRGARPKPSNH